MSPWALMMPESGESSAPAERTCGSRAAVAAAERRSSSTPLARARSRRASSAGSSDSSMAVMIFPQRRWGTPRAVHIS